MGKTDKKAIIMIVDDSEICRSMLREILSDEYELTEAVSGSQALSTLYSMPLKPDLIILDVIMPDMDGYLVISLMKKDVALRDIPVMYITVSDNEYKGLNAGAVDYIAKPFNPEAVKLRVSNQIELRRYRKKMEHMVDEKAHELFATKELILETLANMVEYRSKESASHIKRIKKIMEILLAQLIHDPVYGRVLGRIDLVAMVKASALHDIGKIGIPDSILLKPGLLLPEEFKLIETHTLIGSDIFKPMLANSEDEYFKYCYEISRSHHEHWNGTGYPDGLFKENIPMSARILALADVYDALVSQRCYKDALTHEQAVEIIAIGSDTQFDPAVVTAFLATQDQIKNTLKKI